MFQDSQTMPPADVYAHVAAAVVVAVAAAVFVGAIPAAAAVAVVVAAAAAAVVVVAVAAALGDSRRSWAPAGGVQPLVAEHLALCYFVLWTEVVALLLTTLTR
jgi:hypothetical protein